LESIFPGPDSPGIPAPPVVPRMNRILSQAFQSEGIAMGPFIRFAACVIVLGGAAILRAGDDGPERLAVINVAIPAKDDNQLGALAISPDGRTLAIGVTRVNFGVQGKVKLYSLPRGKHVRTL